MDITEFKRILTSFADEPSDVDVRQGKVIAQIRDDLVDASISYAPGGEGQLQITENGVQYSARSWLVNRVAKLPQLADRIIATNANTQVLPFVTPSGTLSSDLSSSQLEDTETSDAVATMLNLASNQVPGATSVLYVTSDAGEGKTTVINRAATKQARLFKDKTASSLIVPIPLSGRAFLTFDDAVIAALVNRFRFSYFYYDAFIHLIRMGVIVPAFDGYEEMLVEGSKGEAVSALGNLVQTLNSSGTIFVAARKAFFEYLSLKTQARLLDAIGDRSASFSRLELNRWDKEQFLTYGRLRGAHDPEDIYEAVAARLGDDHPLLTRAVLVNRLFDVASNGGDRRELAELLGSNPHDYFYTFVDAIVKREASEKWLAKVSGEVGEPLLEKEEHHLLLANIAVEMWQTSTNSLRHDLLDVVVDLFAETQGKTAGATRQIKERIKQHSLLVADTSRGNAVAFDHEDFQTFYLGEGLGQLLVRANSAELRAFLAINLIPPATVEQAVQYLVRHSADVERALECILSINQSEPSFSFCKENCGAVALRLGECISTSTNPKQLTSMFFSLGALSGRKLSRILFDGCHFQPTSTLHSSFEGVRFKECLFERLEATTPDGLTGCQFQDCRFDSMRLSEDEQTFDPALIGAWLLAAGASVDAGGSETGEICFPADERMKVLERFLRAFLRSTHIDENFIRLRVGRNHAALFFDDLLPALIEEGVLEEVPWKGQGVQHRYKLKSSMADINQALENSHGSFEGFLSEIREAVN